MIRVRFAPSPSGHLHVGNARTALYNWFLARGRHGSLILRIEDTDVARSTPESEQAILDDLRWLGLDWDEGPDLGGPCGPYRQSERLARYTDIARDWVRRGLAYYCFCSAEELELGRQTALSDGRPPKYSGRCRAIDPAVAAARVAGGEPAAIRFRVTRTGDIVFRDLVRGEVTFHTDVIGDFVIMRSNGRPQYNFAVAIDDHEMGITHVVRGEDHISNTPRQLILYDALAAPPPAFGHVSLVLGPDHAPLSKRHGATSVAEFRERGYLPEALVNYLALLGWSPGQGNEIVPAREMAGRFDLGTVSHSPAVFDVDKLAWINRHYMKEAPPARVARDAMRYFLASGYLTAVTPASTALVEDLLPLAVGSVDRLEDIPDRVKAVFDWDPEQAAARVSGEPDGAAVVAAFAAAAAGAGPLDREAFRRAAADARERSGRKGRALFHPIRVALTGADAGPELDLLVPAIDRAASVDASQGVRSVLSCAGRALAVVELLRTVS
jgi:glutamyl-tRNA synthetase